MESGDEEYPHISEYAIHTIEGYCMLNMKYSMKKDPYNYQYIPDGSFRKLITYIMIPPANQSNILMSVFAT